MTRALKPAEYRAINRRHHKFSAKSRVVEGITFPSRLQAQRYGELRLLEKAGMIKELRLELPYRITINDQLVCVYKADFVYDEFVKEHAGWVEWRVVIEDAKGMQTPVYRLKKKLMKAVHGITIREFV